MEYFVPLPSDVHFGGQSVEVGERTECGAGKGNVDTGQQVECGV